MTRTLLLPCLLFGCAISAPFEGPMYDDGLIDPADDYVVAVTYIKIQSGTDVRDLFDMRVADITDSLDDQPGFVGSSLRAAIPGRERWTLTVWTDEAALMDFVMGPTHMQALGDLGIISDTTTSTHFTAPGADIPVPWDVALAALDMDTP